MGEKERNPDVAWREERIQESGVRIQNGDGAGNEQEEVDRKNFILNPEF
jgi:hypothetical protein